MLQSNDICYSRRDDPRDAVVLRVDQQHKDLSSLAPGRFDCVYYLEGSTLFYMLVMLGSN